jgi:hypothetical protein
LSLHEIDPLVELGAERRPQMRVRVERRRDAGVAQAGLDLLRVGPLCDEQGGAGVSKVVEPQTSVQAGPLDRRLPVPAPERRPGEEGSVSPKKDEVARRAVAEVFRQDVDEEGRDAQVATAGKGGGFF